MKDFVNWRKSSRSAQEECVEVGSGTDVVGVRDTKDRAGGTVVLTVDAWSEFLAGVRAGRFDLT